LLENWRIAKQTLTTAISFRVVTDAKPIYPHIALSKIYIEARGYSRQAMKTTWTS